MIKNVVFDIGNVLVSFRWDDLATELGFDEDNIRVMNERVIGDRWNELDRGVMSEAEAVEYIKEALPGMEEKFDVLWSRIGEVIDPYDYSKDWVMDLKAKGANVYLLSNFPRDLFTRLSKTKMPFLPYVDGKIISAFVQKIKPDAEIYECLMDTYGLNPEECIFIDDRKVNVDAALALGMQGIVFTSYEEVRKELDERLMQS
jgi:putative hydrolase of the HAD superfamily